jgi:hypothetical protein
MTLEVNVRVFVNGSVRVRGEMKVAMSRRSVPFQSD